MKTNETINKKTNLYEKFLENRQKDCNLGGYPVDISAIYAFGIDAEDLEPYDGNPDYANVHWSVILEEILDKRKNKG